MKKKPDLEGKMMAIKSMRNFASDLMKKGLGNKLMDMKKVTVASDSKEGLKKGLEKAEEMVEKPSEEMPEMEENSEEMEESPEEEKEESSEYDFQEVLDKCESPEQIDELIKKLEAKKEELSK